jgi:nitrite reductase/ring-hydroxylating ferredoxin subunit
MIPNRWYPIYEARKLKAKPVQLKRMNQELVVWRGPDGPITMSAYCPHRGAALGQGRVKDSKIVCPWHGFEFAADGGCALMPCEGVDATIPTRMAAKPFPTREAHGLVWLWWGEARADYPPIDFFDEPEMATCGWAEISYELPHPYTRTVESSLDIHHTPFAHGSVIPVGAVMDEFDARIEGDRIYSGGVLRREKSATKGMPFRADMIFPNLNFIELAPKIWIVVAGTPIDDDNTWFWARYYIARTRSRLLQTFASWASVQGEYYVVQPQDWRIFNGMAPGTIDEVEHHLVGADKAIALYKRRRRQLLTEADMKEAV